MAVLRDTLKTTVKRTVPSFFSSLIILRWMSSGPGNLFIFSLLIRSQTSLLTSIWFKSLVKSSSSGSGICQRSSAMKTDAKNVFLCYLQRASCFPGRSPASNIFLEAFIILIYYSWPGIPQSSEFTFVFKVTDD